MTPFGWRLAAVILAIASLMFLAVVIQLGRQLNRPRIDYILFAHIIQGRETCTYMTIIAFLLACLCWGASLWH